MATVGRAFGFYIKYWQEMEACFVDKLPLMPPPKKDTPEMIKKVGFRAREQAAKLLKSCGVEIREHFSETLGCQAKVRSQRDTIENFWTIEVRLGRRGGRKSRNILWTTGAFIVDSHDDPDPAIFLYVWTSGQNGQGGRQAEEDLAKLFGEKRVKGRADAIGANVGTVAFGKIPLKEKVDNKTFDIEEEDLLEEVRGLLKTFRKKDIDRLFEI